MTINHHPDDASLVSFVAGALEASFEIVVACHLSQCSHCRDKILQMENVGHSMFQAVAPVMPKGRDDFLASLGVMESSETIASNQRIDSMPCDDGLIRDVTIPSEITRVLNGEAKSLQWKSVAPGIQQIKLECQDNNLSLLKIAPGTSVPLHGHQGSEMSMVIQGSFSDEIGRFRPGDVEDICTGMDHQPITDRSEDCICIVALDGPVQFHGIMPKLFQSLTGL
jgi:putative transcriptional regulator